MCAGLRASELILLENTETERADTLVPRTLSPPLIQWCLHGPCLMQCYTCVSLKHPSYCTRSVSASRRGARGSPRSLEPGFCQT